MPSNVDAVRALWRAFEHDGADAIARYAHPRSEWRPSSAGGRVLHGPEDIRQHFRALSDSGVQIRARLHELEDHGDTVLVRGSLRVERFGALSESTMVWSYRFEDGKVMCARAFYSRADALASIAAAAAPAS